MKLRTFSILYVEQLTTIDGINLFTAFDLNMTYNFIFHSAKWFKQLESQLLFNNSERLLSNNYFPHTLIIKAPTQPSIFTNSKTNPTFVVIWSNQYIMFILGKIPIRNRNKEMIRF